MSKNTNPEPQPEQELDDLGLSYDDWQDLAYAYNHGLIEPAEGTVEAEAFRRMDAYARQEASRVAQEREWEWAAQTRNSPGPGAQPETGSEPELPF